MIRRIQSLEHIRRLQAVGGEQLGLELHVQLGLARRHGQAHVAAAWEMLQHFDDLRTDPVVGVEIGADHADGERRRFTRQGLADALRQHGIDLDELVRIIVEHVADGSIDLAGIAQRRIDLHLELALVGRVGVLAVLRTTDLLGHALDAGNGDEAFRDLLAHPRGLGKRDAGAQRGVRDQVILTKIRKQARAEQRQEHDSRDARCCDDGDEHAGTIVQPGDRAQLAALAIHEEARLGPGLMPRHDKHTHRRRRAHRDEKRKTHRQQKRDRQRPEECALQSRHHQDGQESDGHRGGRVENRTAHFERCADEQRDEIDVGSRHAAAAQNILDVDDGIVDHHAERHHEASEGHGVQGQAHGLQNPDGGQQGERDGAEGHQRAAPVAQRHEQQRDHEHRADEERVAQLLDRALDETRGTQQRRMVLDALLGERRCERIEPLFERAGDVERVRTELRRGLDENSGLARDERIAEARLCAVAHFGDIPEAYG